MSRSQHHGLVLLAWLPVLILLVGCGGYGEVGPLTYEYATALYSQCNRRDADRLDRLWDMIEISRDQQEIGHREAEWLGDIIRTAQNGEWEEATKQSRRMLEDQVQGR